MRSLFFVAGIAVASVFASGAWADGKSATFALNSGMTSIDLAHNLDLPSGDFHLTLDVIYDKVLVQTLSGGNPSYQSTGIGVFNEYIPTTKIYGGSVTPIGVTLFSGEPGLAGSLFAVPPPSHNDVDLTPGGSSTTCPPGFIPPQGAHCHVTIFNRVTTEGIWGESSASLFLSAAQAHAIDVTGLLPIEVNIPQGEFVTASLTISTPEPASWALMILGFGGVGAALRRRRAPLAS